MASFKDLVVIALLTLMLCCGSTFGMPACIKRDHRSCSYYGGRESYYCPHKWMRRNCGQMCGRCQYTRTYKSPPAPRAVVIIPGIECTGPESPLCWYFAHGDKKYYCAHPWMHINCKYTCNICAYL